MLAVTFLVQFSHVFVFVFVFACVFVIVITGVSVDSTCHELSEYVRSCGSVKHRPLLGQITGVRQTDEMEEEVFPKERTWASCSVAVHCLLQSWTRSSPILWLFDDISCSCLGSTVASHTAVTPWLPIANLAVN